MALCKKVKEITCYSTIICEVWTRPRRSDQYWQLCPCVLTFSLQSVPYKHVKIAVIITGTMPCANELEPFAYFRCFRNRNCYFGGSKSNHFICNTQCSKKSMQNSYLTKREDVTLKNYFGTSESHSYEYNLSPKFIFFCSITGNTVNARQKKKNDFDKKNISLVSYLKICFLAHKIHNFADRDRSLLWCQNRNGSIGL